MNLLSSNFEKVIDTINELRESHQKDKEDIIEAIKTKNKDEIARLTHDI